MNSIYTPKYQSLRERLRQARRAVGLTQEAVAKHLGKPQSFVSKAESGERRIDPTELGRFAKLYGQPFSFFVGD